MRKQYRRKKRPFLFLSILILGIAGLYFAFQLALAAPCPAYEAETGLQLHSANAILIDLDCGTVLFEQDSTERIYPASLVKMMTALVAIEHIDDLNAEIALCAAMFPPLYRANAAVAGFWPGEKVRAIDLLYGLLLPSGAECAIGLAEHVAGSESAFVELMNQKGQELGMNHTRFANASGLHDSNQYSTVSDMSILLLYALDNSVFYQIFTSAKHSAAPTSQREAGPTLYSTLFSRMPSPHFENGSILGGRTGFTRQAGQCLASLALVNGRKFILVTAGANGDPLTDRLHIDDAFAIYNNIARSEDTRSF